MYSVSSSSALIGQVNTSPLIKTPKLKEVFKENSVPILALMSSHLLIDIYNSLLPIISPLLVQKFTLSFSAIGALSALLSFTGAFMQPIYGYLSDRTQNKWLVLSAPILIALATLGLASASSLPIVILSLILLGTGFSLYHPKTTAMVGSISQSFRSTLVSFFVASGSLGSALSPMFVLLFVTKDLNSLTNLSYAWIPCVFAFTAIWVAKSSFTNNSNTTHSKTLYSLSQVLQRCLKKDLILLSLIVAARSASVLTLVSFVAQLITKSWGESLLLAGWAATLLNVGSLLGGLTGGSIANRVNPKFALIFSLFIAAPCFFAFLHNQSLVFLGLGSFFSAWSNSICVSLSQQAASAKIQSTASSLTMGFAWGLGAMVIPFVGMLADTTSLNNALIYALTIPLLVAAFVSLFLSSVKNN